MRLSCSHSLIVLAAILLFQAGRTYAQQQAAPRPKAAPIPAFAPIKDDPALPRVLLIGDSISVGYTLVVREILAGKANVHRPPTNCGNTTKGLRYLSQWLGDGHWDVIHFNWGLHDLTSIDDKPEVPINEYEKNLRTLVARLKETSATLVWCSTTPVPPGRRAPLKPEDVARYNEVARKIMDENGIAIDDLYAFALPRLSQIQLPSNVHVTPEGSKVLARQVAASIEAALKQRPAGLHSNVTATSARQRAFKNEFFAFGKAAPRDPEAKKAFLVDQIQKVEKSFRNLTTTASTPYETSILLDPDQVSVQKIKDRLKEYAQTLTAEDTFVMYAHGHGNPKGMLLDFTPPLGGVFSWNDLTEAILALPARNVIVFMMTCDSGRLADVVKSSEAKWRGRSHQGRNLIVLTSVSSDQIANRSYDDTIGNPFTYAVRTAIDGQADGFTGGIRDGRIDMDELVRYVLAVAREKSGLWEHRPKFAGEYVASDVFAIY